MSMRASALVAATAALISCCSAQQVKYEKYALSNGMTVILHEDHSLPVSTVNIWYHVGSKDEPAKRSGFAHLFEHLMFMGTKRAPKGDFDNLMEAGGGNNNASTTQDRTNYYDYGPSSLLPTLLWLEADRLEDLGRMMDQKKLDLQREVVKNERRENFENAPYGFAPLKIDEAMYPESHPYHIDTIGLPEDIDAATVRDVQSFFATFYVPNNATMVIAGDFDSKAIKPLVEKLFGTLPRSNDPIHRAAPELALHEAKRLTMVDKVPLGRLYMVWHSPPIYKPGDGEMDLTAAILSDGFASRLNQRLVVKDKLASDVSADQDSQLLGSLFSVTATANAGVSLDKLEAAMNEEIARFREEGPTVDELGRVKAKYEFGALNGLQSLSDVADRLNQYDFYRGEPDSFRWDLERHTHATASEIRDWARRTLDPNARLILRIVPESESVKQNPRDEAPGATRGTDFKFPSPTVFTLSNGLKVSFFSRGALPLMSATMMFRRGATSDPPSKSGLAGLTTAMLDQGAGALDAEGFSRALEHLGAYFNASAGAAASSASISSTAANFEGALGLFADAIIRPHLEAGDVERRKALLLDSLSQEADDPENVARVVSMREFFGEDHAYGRDHSGSQASVKSITLDDIRREYGALVRPENAELLVAGSLPLEAVKAALEKQFGGWKAATGKLLEQPASMPPANKALRVVIVDRPDAVQTVIRCLFPGVPQADPRRLSLQALITVLGGTFTSRLNANLREAKGYTYGASARAFFEPKVGYITAQSSVRADVTGAALSEMLSEFRSLRSGNVTEAEAIMARASLQTDAMTSMSTLGGLLGKLELLSLNGQTMSDLSKELEVQSKISGGALNAIAANALPLDRGLIVLVGDKNLILKQIAGLPLPKPEVVRGLE